MDNPLIPDRGLAGSLLRCLVHLPECVSTRFSSPNFSTHSNFAKFQIGFLDTFIANLHYKHTQVFSPNRPVKSQLKSKKSKYAKLKLNNYAQDYKPGYTDAQWLYEKPNRLATDPVIVFYHGGGYVYGFRNDTHLKYLISLTKALGPEVSILVVDYLLQPYPSPVVNNLELWREMFINDNLQNVITMGDSAGAHLILTTLAVLENPQDFLSHIKIDDTIWWNQTKIARFKHVLISPWVDLLPLDSKYKSTEENLKLDILNKYRSQGWGLFVTMNATPPDLVLTDFRNSLHDKNTFIIVGENEMLRDSIVAFSNSIKGKLYIEKQGVHDQFTMEEFLGYGYDNNDIFLQMLDFIMEN